MAPRVEAVVMATESGTSARATNATTLEATPPGQHATRQMPTVDAGSRAAARETA
jgi:hypothetical protein